MPVVTSYPACPRGRTPAGSSRWCGRAALHDSAPGADGTTSRTRSPNSSERSPRRSAPGTEEEMP